MTMSIAFCPANETDGDKRPGRQQAVRLGLAKVQK